jgi:hypothetical protein
MYGCTQPLDIALHILELTLDRSLIKKFTLKSSKPTFSQRSSYAVSEPIASRAFCGWHAYEPSILYNDYTSRVTQQNTP